MIDGSELRIGNYQHRKSDILNQIRNQESPGNRDHQATGAFNQGELVLLNQFFCRECKVRILNGLAFKP